MRQVRIKILLPECVYKCGIWVLLLYRRLRYGCAFRIIPLTKGLVAIVSSEDYERVSQYKWHSARHGRSIYAQTGTGSKKAGKPFDKAQGGRKRHLIMMHRMIMGVEDDRLVDHQNHNGLDNRPRNLRIATWAENCWNKRKPLGRGSSQFKGVMWDKRRSIWQVMIGYKGKKIFIGYFKDEIEAAKAYDAKAKELYGEFAALNFPEQRADPLGDWSFRICYGGYSG